MKLIALITIEVHTRDITDTLSKKCFSPNSFEWKKQLRFRANIAGELANCYVDQTNTSFEYGYEYQGNNGRLVVTALTDRCYMTLTTAMHLKKGGAPQGPAGTGKTETVKDLAKSLALRCVVTNCGETLDYVAMGIIFSGLV